MDFAAKKQLKELIHSLEYCIDSVPESEHRAPTEGEVLSYLIDQECNIASAVLKGEGRILGFTIPDILALRKLCHQAQLQPGEATEWAKDYCLVKTKTVHAIHELSKAVAGR